MALTTSSSAGFRPDRLPTGLYVVGLMGIFFGQRILEVGRPSTVVTGVGALLLLAAIAARLVRAKTRPENDRGPERVLAGLYALGTVAVLLYFINSDLTFSLTGRTLEQRAPRLSGILSALFPALMLAGTLPVMFVEMALSTMARSPLVDGKRVRAALLSGLGISFALVFTFAISYVASERDVKADLSYFRTARAGESTHKIVQALDKPVEIHLFFPPANEVREEVDSYFSEISRDSKFLKVSHYDFALHPARARELGVSGNGIIVIARDALREQIPLPLQLEAARSALKVLDQDVNRRLLGVTRKARIAYFTQGHEERGSDAASDTDRRDTIRVLRSLLTDQGFEPRELGLAQGLGTDVPADATLVLIIGPRKPLSTEESAALVRYIDRKGRLFIALDPEGGQSLPDLLAPLSLKYTPVTLANDKFFGRRTYQNADRINILTSSYSSHASVSTLSKPGTRAALILVGAGYLEKSEKGAVGIVNVDFTVHAEGSTWNDVNGNFEHDPTTEIRNAYELAAAVSKRNASALMPEDEARAVVLADSDAITDQLMAYAGNHYLALDAVRWLGGEERISGAISNEEDVPVAHTRKQDLAWFYSSILLAPAAIVGAGFFMTRRRRKRKTPPQDTTAARGSP